MPGVAGQVAVPHPRHWRRGPRVGQGARLRLVIQYYYIILLYCIVLYFITVGGVVLASVRELDFAWLYYITTSYKMFFFL